MVWEDGGREAPSYPIADRACPKQYSLISARADIPSTDLSDIPSLTESPMEGPYEFYGPNNLKWTGAFKARWGKDRLPCG